MASETVQADSFEVFSDLGILSIEDQGQFLSDEDNQDASYKNHGGVCAICLNKIALQETALVKGCEHAYCVTCILQWTTFTTIPPTCPKCKHKFEFLNIHRTLDGSIKDYMFEESVCLLQRASWFKGLVVAVEHEEAYDWNEGDNDGCDGDAMFEDDYFNEDESSSSGALRIGNRRWGDNGYVRAGRREARPARRSHADASSSSQKKEMSTTGRRARRTLKREASSK